MSGGAADLPGLAVTDIAFDWGFNNLSSCYRAFQAAFGLPPGDLCTSLQDQRGS